MHQSHVPQCTSLISHNAPFCNRNVHMCAHFCCKIVHCGMFIWCIMGFVRWVYWKSKVVVATTFLSLLAASEVVIARLSWRQPLVPPVLKELSSWKLSSNLIPILWKRSYKYRLTHLLSPFRKASLIRWILINALCVDKRVNFLYKILFQSANVCSRSTPFFFYPRPVLVSGHCRCLRLSVCPDFRPCVNNFVCAITITR